MEDTGKNAENPKYQMCSSWKEFLLDSMDFFISYQYVLEKFFHRDITPTCLIGKRSSKHLILSQAFDF